MDLGFQFCNLCGDGRDRIKDRSGVGLGSFPERRKPVFHRADACLGGSNGKDKLLFRFRAGNRFRHLFFRFGLDIHSHLFHILDCPLLQGFSSADCRDDHFFGESLRLKIGDLSEPVDGIVLIHADFPDLLTGEDLIILFRDRPAGLFVDTENNCDLSDFFGIFRHNALL